MPYMIQKNSDGEFCVHKQDADGMPMGDSMGCHPTRAEAKKQMVAIMANEDMPEAGKAYAVKAFEGGKDNEIEILVPYGGPYGKGVDAVNDYFTPDTDFAVPKLPDVPRPVVYFHAVNDAKPEVIGTAISFRDAPEGRWYKTVLDKSKSRAKQSLEALAKGTLRASSQAVLSFVRRVKTDIGQRVTNWPIVELTLVDERDGDKRVVNPFAVVQPAYAKAVLSEVGLDIGGETAELTQPDQPPNEGKGKTKTNEVKGFTMDEKELQEMVAKASAEAVATALKAKEDSDKTEKERNEKIEADKKAAVESALKARDDEDAKKNRLPGGAAPYVAEFGNVWKYDNLDAGDTAVMIGVLQSAGKEVSENALKALAIKLTDSEDRDGKGGQFARERMAMKAVGMPMKADELNQSILAGFGDEWIGVTYSNQLWDKIRSLSGIVGMLPAVEVPQGSESVVIPLQGASPTFYKVAQASAQATNTLGAVTNTITSSKLATTNQSLTVGKLGAAVIYASELEEDSLIPWAAELRSDLEQEGAEVLESLVIDGDTATTASTNINDIAGTPASTDYYLVANGFRKLALVTNTANSRAAGGLDVSDFLETVKLMGLAGKNAVQKDKVKFIVDMWTMWKALELAEVKTRDSFASPTIENGQLTSLWGYSVIPSANMHRVSTDSTYGLKANSAGKVDVDTAANNLYGAILAVRVDQWRMGFKRRMRFETQRIPRADSTELTVTMRVGLINRDNDASAISYGVGV